MIESLVRASAFDCFGIARSQLVAVLDPFMTQLQNARRQSMEGQLSLFGLDLAASDSTEAEPNYPALPEFSPADLLAMEKEDAGSLCDPAIPS